MQMNSWIFLGVWVFPILSTVECSWGSPSDGQYHIQTDEGPERYFRFQTDNGQFRKERRLQDGTVIGTEAWIDAAGFLRQKDYIADSKGYRILKSKTVFVGYGRQIQDAIKSTKSVPAQSGVLVDGKNNDFGSSANSVGHSGDSSKLGGYVYSPTTSPIPIPITSTTTTTATPIDDLEIPPRLGYLSPAEAAKIEPSPYLGFDHYPDELPRRAHTYPSRQPVVHIRPHAEPIEDHNNNFIGDGYYSTSSTTERTPFSPSSTPSTLPLPSPSPSPTPAAPSLAMEPPLLSRHGHRRVQPIAVIGTKPAPYAAHQVPSSHYGFSTPAPFATVSPKGEGYHYAPSSTPATSAAIADEAPAQAPPRAVVLPLEVNNLDDGLLPPPPPSYNHRRMRPHPNNVLENYDGVGVTHNGFRYFLPHQYHEEEQIDDHKRAGSFGYVDPFGIRRVVYYNASPERGFVHRNNNRYVGVGGAPYDPVV